MSWLNPVVPYAAFGGGAGAGFMFIKWLLEFLARRWDQKEATVDAGTQKLIENLEKRLDAVTERLDKAETDLADCKRKHAESEAEVMQLRAMLQGYGDARQVAQLQVAADKRATK